MANFGNNKRGGRPAVPQAKLSAQKPVANLKGPTVKRDGGRHAIVFDDLHTVDLAAYDSAFNRVQNLLTAYERRGSLSKAEVLQLADALELMNEYQNNNSITTFPNFNSTDLEALGLKQPNIALFPIHQTGAPDKANVIDDSFRAIREFLFGDLYDAKGNKTSPEVEHIAGAFPSQQKNPGVLLPEEIRIGAVVGIVANTQAVPPQYKTNPDLLTLEDETRRDTFNQTVSVADGQYRTNPVLYQDVVKRLADVGGGQVVASDWAKVVDILVGQGVKASDYQLETKIDRALAAAQNVGQDRPPSLIDIDLPDLDQEVSAYEIVKENIFALQPAYFAAMFEELKVFQVVDKLVELFQNGVLPVGKGNAGNLLFTRWKNAALRVSEAERRGFYARTLGIPGGDDGGAPNREFKDLFMRFVSAVSSFVRQTNLDNLLRANIPGAVSQQQIRKAGRDLATNLSSHGYGMAYPMATELQTQINEVIAILKNSEIQNAYGAKDMWQVVDQVSGLELGGTKNSVKYRTMASAGATVFAWLANRSQLLSAGVYTPIIDVTVLQNPPFQITKPTKDPSDYDLVGACDQWLAVTGTQEESREKMAEPTEAPVMPSRPIQIPSIARDMLESVGVPAMAYSAGTGKPNGAPSWRYGGK